MTNQEYTQAIQESARGEREDAIYDAYQKYVSLSLHPNATREEQQAQFAVYQQLREEYEVQHQYEQLQAAWAELQSVPAYVERPLGDEVLV